MTAQPSSARLIHLLSAPSLVFVGLFLFGCSIYGDAAFTGLLAVGILVGFFAVGLSLVSKNAGTIRFNLRLMFFVMTVAAVLLVVDQYRPLSTEEAIPVVQSWRGRLGISKVAGTDDKVVNSAQLIDIPITGHDLRYITPFEQLSSLDLDYTHIGNGGLKHVGRLVNLTWLDIEDTNISDDGLIQLQGLQKLTSLIIDGNDISDEGLEHLARLKSLTRVRVRNTRITPAGAKSSEAALPGCRVEFD